MTSPLRQLWQSIAAIIDSIDLNRNGQQFPCILIDQLNIRPSIVTKDAEDWTGTFLIEVVSKSESPSESVLIIEQIQEAMSPDTLQVDGFTVQKLTPEELTPILEVTDGMWRQLQRYRVLLTKND